MADSNAASTGEQKAQQAICLWHLLGIDEVLQRLEVSTAGLEITEAQERLMTWRSTFSWSLPFSLRPLSFSCSPSSW